MENYRNRIYKNYPKLKKSKSIEGISREDYFRSRAPYLNKIIKNYFPKDTTIKILELGCGPGAFIHFLKLMNYSNVVGIDVSPDQVNLANTLGVEGVIQGDLMNYLTHQPDESQDMVISFDVIEHFNKEELICFVDEVKRVLRVNGRWVIHTPNGESPFFGRILYGDFTHELAFTRSSLTQLLFTSGFSNIESYEDKPVVHGLVSACRKIIWECFRIIMHLYLAAESGQIDRHRIFSQNFLTIANKSSR